LFATPFFFSIRTLAFSLQDAGRHPARSTPTDNGDAPDAPVTRHLSSNGTSSGLTF